MSEFFGFDPLFSVLAVGSEWHDLADPHDVEKSWRGVFNQISAQTPPHCERRLISGLRCGAEQNALDEGGKLGFEVHLLLATGTDDTPNLAELEAKYNIQRIVSLNKHHDNSAYPFILRNELGLNFADMIACYWDAFSMDSAHRSTLRHIRHAALSRKPVIWVNPLGEIYWLKLTSLDDATLVLLQASENSTHILIDCFEKVSDPSQLPIQAYIQKLLNPNGQQHNEASQNLFELTQDKSEPEKFKDTGNLDKHLSRLLSLKCRFCSWFKQHIPLLNGHYWHKTPNEIQPHKTLIEAFYQHEKIADRAGGLHRSNIWLLYGFSALAVLVAVSAEVWHQHWMAFVELGLITSIMYRVWWAKKIDLHDKWIRHRYLAEQLRYCIMGYPVLSIPKPFRQPFWQIKDNQIELQSAELWLLQRHLVTTGLPCDQGKHYRPANHNLALAEHILAAIRSQKAYHQHHHHQKHQGHKRLHILTEISFVLTFIAVVAHIALHEAWLLMFTAALPAVAAGIHGILTKLEMERIAGQSAMLYQQLEQYENAMIRFIDSLKQDKQDDWHQWVSLHHLADRAQQTMSDNITQWQHLILKQKTEIPA